MKRIIAIIFLVIAGTAVFSLLAFRSECDHIYVVVVQPEIKVEQFDPESFNKMTPAIPMYYERKTGKQKGGAIVCVKCHNVTHQIEDYGK